MYPISDNEVYWFTCFNAPNGGGPSAPEVLLTAAAAASRSSPWPAFRSGH